MFDWISFKVGQAYLALRREDGQGATEYAMVLGFVVVGLTITLGVLGVAIDGFLGRVAAKINLMVP
jgi:Flp pilus assembly pilin Flp